ncbi:hypothetical protein E5D57_007877 [Metarhizium anisopliae]|nr:hypothetical protein E5D57_007877 [Metarhizium anisopliae]
MPWNNVMDDLPASLQPFRQEVGEFFSQHQAKVIAMVLRHWDSAGFHKSQQRPRHPQRKPTPIRHAAECEQPFMDAGPSTTAVTVGGTACSMLPGLDSAVGNVSEAENHISDASAPNAISQDGIEALLHNFPVDAYAPSNPQHLAAQDDPAWLMQALHPAVQDGASALVLEHPLIVQYDYNLDLAEIHLH